MRPQTRLWPDRSVDRLMRRYDEDRTRYMGDLDGRPVFHGVRVLEMSTVIAGPTASMMMAELGAEVGTQSDLSELHPFRQAVSVPVATWLLDR